MAPFLLTALRATMSRIGFWGGVPRQVWGRAHCINSLQQEFPPKYTEIS